MGTIATKLTYLDETKEEIRNGINSIGGELTSSDTFRSYASELENLYNSFPKVSGTGSALNLTPTGKGRIESEIQGDTQQGATPTPSSPQPISVVTGGQEIKTEGKQLLPYPYDETTKTTGGITFTDNGDGSITISNTATANAYFNNFPNTAGIRPKYKAGTYTFSNDALLPSGITITFSARNSDGTAISGVSAVYLNNTTKEATLTINQDFEIMCNILVSNGTALSTPITVYPMIEKGSSATTFEAYKGQSYEINLGKQIFNYDLARLKSINTGGNWVDNAYTQQGITYTYNNDGTLTLSGTSTNLSYIDVYSSKTENLISNTTKEYTFSKGITNTNIPIAIYEYINNSWANVKYVNTPSTTYIPSGNRTGQMFRIIVNSGVQITTPITIYPQLEKGSVSTSYSSYKTPIELCKIGDYQDKIYKEAGKCYIERQIGKIVLNGSETWNVLGSNPNRYYTGAYSNKLSGLSVSEALSNYFVFDGITVASTNDKHFFFNKSSGQTVSNGNLSIIYNDIASANDLQTWILAHNTIIYYILAEPTTTEITDTELLTQLEAFYNAKSYDGQTNISVLSADLPIDLNVSALKKYE